MILKENVTNEIITMIQNDAVIRYTERYKKLGVTPRSLGWGCREDQLIRFEALVKSIDLEGKTILDIGCGFSDLLLFLNNKGIKVRYIGVDIIPDFIDYCQKTFPEHEFYNLNVMLDGDKIPEVDVAVSFGLLNFKLKEVDNYDYTKTFITRAFNKVRDALIVDFLSTHLTPEYPKEDIVFYHEPERMFNYGLTLTPYVSLIHNYKPNPQKEYLLILYKGE